MKKFLLTLSFCFALAFCALAPIAASAAQFSVIYTFKGGADGAYPAIGLLRTGDGTLYGTTEGQGGKKGFGTVFRLKPTSKPNVEWPKATLYSFKGGSDGAFPWTRLIFDMDTGALLGTTAGDDIKTDRGTIFRLVPTKDGSVPWTEQIIHRFGGGVDSGFPYDALAQEPGNGSVYGTTYGGSAKTDFGSVFGYTPDTKRTKWTRTLRYDFTGASGNGAYPEAGLVRGRAGTFYGTTFGGGKSSAPCSVGSLTGCGTIFTVNPANGHVTFLYLSSGVNVPVFFSYGELLLDRQFNIYGASPAGGPSATCKIAPYTCGTVFSFDPDGGKPPKVLQPLVGAKASGQSDAGLIWDLTRTILYGTTAFGGTHKCQSGSVQIGCGFVFKLAPDGNKWVLTVLHDFTGGADGNEPHDLVLDTEGTLYGEAERGGKKGFGTVFRIESP